MSFSLDENLESAGGGLQLSREQIGAIFLETVNLPEKRLKRFLTKNKENDELAKEELKRKGLITLADLCNYSSLEDVSLAAALFILKNYVEKIVERKIQNEAQNGAEIFEVAITQEVFEEAFSHFLKSEFEIRSEVDFKSIVSLAEKCEMGFDLISLPAVLGFLTEEYIKKNYRASNLFGI